MSKYKDNTEVFDTERLLLDAYHYQVRQRLTYTDMARRAGCSRTTIREVLEGKSLSLWMACRLADVCDLSLDDYRKEDNGRTRVA